MGQERRSRNDIKTILSASAIPAFNVIARSVLSARTSDRDEVSAGNLSLCEDIPCCQRRLMTIAEIATTGEGQVRRSRNDIKPSPAAKGAL